MSTTVRILLASVAQAQPAPYPVPLLQISLIVPLIVIVGVAVIVLVRRHAKKQTDAFQAVAGARSLVYTRALTVVDGLLPALHGTGKQKYQHVMTGEIDGRPVAVGQHYYMVHTGKTVVAVHHAVACVGIGPGWPALRIEPSNVLTRAMESVGLLSDVELEREAFNRKFRLLCEDETFAVALLSGEAQDYLLDRAPTASWRIGAGRMALVRRTTLKPAHVGTMLDTLSGLLALIPRELESYGEESRAGA